MNHLHHDFVFGADIEISFSGYPLDVDNREEWDMYWRYHANAGALTKGSKRKTMRKALVRKCEPTWLSTFEARGYRSMLFVGNGMSQEPQFFAYAGYRATAMDLSSAVTKAASKAGWQARTMLDCFGVTPERERVFLRELHRFGGTADYQQGDLFGADSCAGPYDVIVTRRTIQLFDGPRLDDAIAALARRLSPQGALLIEVHQDIYAYNAIQQRLRQQGFRLRGDKHKDWNAQLLLCQRD